MHTNKNIFDLQTPLNNNASRDKLLTLALKKRRYMFCIIQQKKLKQVKNQAVAGLQALIALSRRK